MQTYREYLSLISVVRDTYALHNAFYGQFIVPDMREHLLSAIPLSRLRQSTDRYFNDIPLEKWDALVYRELPPWECKMVRTKSLIVWNGSFWPQVDSLLREAGTFLSLSVGVSILKTLAHNLVR